MDAVGVRATLLSPLTYHGLMVQGGSATVHHLLSDTALAFGLASTLGWMPQGPGLPTVSDYHGHLAAMPYRCSLLTPARGAPEPSLMPPQARKLNIDAEGGRPKRLADMVASGNVKDYFMVQSIAPGAVYEGLVSGETSPFEQAGTDALVVRMGLHRQGIVLVERAEVPERVRLNAHTGALFGRTLACQRYHLHTLQQTGLLASADAVRELAAWH